eukprot:93269-Chlamydomonas_euryale.AAC.1
MLDEEVDEDADSTDDEAAGGDAGVGYQWYHARLHEPLHDAMLITLMQALFALMMWRDEGQVHD